MLPNRNNALLSNSNIIIYSIIGCKTNSISKFVTYSFLFFLLAPKMIVRKSKSCLLIVILFIPVVMCLSGHKFSTHFKQFDHLLENYTRWLSASLCAFFVFYFCADITAPVNPSS